MKAIFLSILLLTPFVLGDLANDASAAASTYGVSLPSSAPSVDTSGVPTSYSSAGASQGQTSGTASYNGGSMSGSGVSAQAGTVDLSSQGGSVSGAQQITTGPLVGTDGNGNTVTGQVTIAHNGNVNVDQNGGSAAGALQIVGSGSGSDGSSIDGVYSINGVESLAGSTWTSATTSASSGSSNAGSAVSAAGAAANDAASNAQNMAGGADLPSVVSQAQGVVGSSGVSLPSSVSGEFNNQTYSANVTDSGISLSVSSAETKSASFGFAVVAVVFAGLAA
eukprot:GILJ01009305.1.p1 GENE.GILJ01009305.1~~GILJ01009305.1.p1  ORF type:complete len:279 (+),score=72.63 GILJ01009305.1:186-1022(+)